MEAELKPLSPQPEPKPDPKPVYVSEPILQPGNQSRPDYDSKPVHHSKPDDESKPDYGSGPEVKPDYQSRPDDDSKPLLKPDDESGPELKPGYQSKPGDESKLLLKPVYGTGPETKPDYGSGPEVKLGYESRPDDDSKPLLKPDYESGTEMKLGYDFEPVTKPEAIAPARPDQDLPAELSIEELEEKFAAYVRRDVYGTMGRGEVPVTEKVLLGFGLVTLVPIRIVLAMTLLVLYYVVCKVCTAAKEANHEEEEQEDYAHLGGWRRGIIVWTGRFLSRAMLFVLGFYWISERECGVFSNGELNNETVPHGQYAEPDSPGAIISNHVSYLDILYHMSSSFPSFVAKRSVARLPLVGLISKCLGCVYVQRESKSSNFKGVSGVIHERICEAHQNADAPRIMLFPEGTTTNGDFLLPFKTGAFLAKAPVRPVILRYPYQRFSPAWDTISGVRHVILLLCQFVNHLEVTRLPVYCPSQQEKDDPKLYAENVRRLMAREGNLTLSDIGLPEKRVYHAALHGMLCQQ